MENAGFMVFRPTVTIRSVRECQGNSALASQQPQSAVAFPAGNGVLNKNGLATHCPNILFELRTLDGWRLSISNSPVRIDFSKHGLYGLMGVNFSRVDLLFKLRVLGLNQATRI